MGNLFNGMIAGEPERRGRKGVEAEEALYGFMQMPREWYTKLDKHIMWLDFTRNIQEHILYMKISTNLRLFIDVYVDDFIVVGSSLSHIEEFKEEMRKVFDMSDIGILNFYFGIQVM